MIRQVVWQFTKCQHKVFIKLQRDRTYVTVQQPSTGVVGPESDRRRSSGRYGDGIPSHGVLLLDDGRVDGCVVREVICRFTHDLEFVTVQVERVETSVATRLQMRIVIQSRLDKNSGCR